MGAIVKHILHPHTSSAIAKWHRPTNAVDQPEAIDWHKLEVFIKKIVTLFTTLQYVCVHTTMNSEL